MANPKTDMIPRFRGGRTLSELKALRKRRNALCAIRAWLADMERGRPACRLRNYARQYHLTPRELDSMLAESDLGDRAFGPLIRNAKELMSRAMEQAFKALDDVNVSWADKMKIIGWASKLAGGQYSERRGGDINIGVNIAAMVPQQLPVGLKRDGDPDVVKDIPYTELVDE